MIASCWDWPTLKYVYFILEHSILDAGGWSATSGIVANSTNTSKDEVVCFEECLPTLPKESYFAGTGDFCVGVLFEKRDNEPRARIDLDAMYAEGTPQEMKIVELLRGFTNSAVQNLRENNAQVKQDETQEESLYPVDRSLWEQLVPIFVSASAGFALYRYYSSFNSGNLSTRDLLFALGAGTALGISIAQEASRNTKIKTTLRR
jgi:hypothetical protein